MTNLRSAHFQLPPQESSAAPKQREVDPIKHDRVEDEHAEPIPK
jgi:hypothetical protein